MAEDSDFLTYREAAAILRVSYPTVVRWTRPGKNGEAPILAAYKIGPNTVRLRRGDVLAMPSPNRRPGGTGHAPGHLREAFIDWVQANYATRDPQETDTVEIDGKELPISWLLGQLWHTTDVLPAGECSDLDLPQGATYAVAVRKVASDLREATP